MVVPDLLFYASKAGAQFAVKSNAHINIFMKQ